MQQDKMRLDLALVERGLVATRARAQAAIKAGQVRLRGQVASKPSEMVAADEDVEFSAPDRAYVSRGALKLLHALDVFSLDPSGLACLDLGASTGGFTQVLLERGAAQVVAIDVGHGQLAKELAGNPHVRSVEGLNARDLTRELVPETFSFITADLSFIGLRKALPPALALAERNAHLVALIKPQFEAGPQNVGKGGIVRDPEIHERICGDISRWLEDEMKWQVLGVTPSPIEGGDGNREFLIVARKT
ncbi:MAG TPA: TlyA family rRNA (cytidine-2'-O)-methyltransferase [Rhodobiaceae bacterium]|nr:TlyA family rRNA (cytidine-2'-O)-methyltransferase [Rhodobiaceae bacterium]